MTYSYIKSTYILFIAFTNVMIIICFIFILNLILCEAFCVLACLYRAVCKIIVLLLFIAEFSSCIVHALILIKIYLCNQVAVVCQKWTCSRLTK